jgi:predicted secreted protein
MTTVAKIGFATLFKIRTATGPDVFTTIGEQASVTPYGVSVDSVDASHEESPNGYREFIPGLKDAGEASFEIHYVPGGTAESLLLGMLGSTQACRTVFPSGAKVDYSAFITEMTPETPIDDKMVMSMTLKITGEMVVSAAAVPANSVLPAVSGLAKVGVTLTAQHGVWTNEPTSFTYQWKKAGADIVGSTGRTYVPVVGDIAAKITVVVTGTNSAGNASATSADPLAVVA